MNKKGARETPYSETITEGGVLLGKVMTGFAPSRYLRVEVFKGKIRMAALVCMATWKVKKLAGSQCMRRSVFGYNLHKGQES